MSLELISAIEEPITFDVQLAVAQTIVDLGFHEVYYFQDYSTRGFVRSGTLYKEGNPPLFELIITDSIVSVGVYGDLNDFSEIRKIITKSFAVEFIDLNLVDELD